MIQIHPENPRSLFSRVLMNMDTHQYIYLIYISMWKVASRYPAVVAIVLSFCGFHDSMTGSYG